MAATMSMPRGRARPTRSPRCTPQRRNAAAMRATRAASSRPLQALPVAASRSTGRARLAQPPSTHSSASCGPTGATAVSFQRASAARSASDISEHSDRRRAGSALACVSRARYWSSQRSAVAASNIASEYSSVIVRVISVSTENESGN